MSESLTWIQAAHLGLGPGALVTHRGGLDAFLRQGVKDDELSDKALKIKKNNRKKPLKSQGRLSDQFVKEFESTRPSRRVFSF